MKSNICTPFYFSVLKNLKPVGNAVASIRVRIVDKNICQIALVDRKANPGGEGIFRSRGIIDGLVIFYEQENDKRISLGNDYGIPTVAFGKSESSLFVSNDNHSAMKQAFSYLFSRKIDTSHLLLGNPTITNTERSQGALAAYKETLHSTSMLSLFWNINTPNDVYNHILDCASKKDFPKVFFVVGDQKALGAYRALDELKLRIPEDVSIIGFDDISISKYLTPPLTTVAQDFRRLAENIIDLIEKMLNGALDIQSRIVPTSLVVRESTK